MWETPIYKFKTEIEGENKEILIDVTGSAPNFTEPGKQLENTFEVLLNGLEPANTKILDFGGAKLRNTLYLLEKGFTVYACEFGDLFKRSKQANNNLGEAKKYANFKELVFPSGFIDFDGKFEVILLINVLNIMPVPIERLCALALCKEKLAENGRLLWYTQHGAYKEDEAVAKLNDGLVTGMGREYNMFYRDFSRKEIHDMLISTGFSYNKDFKFSAGKNQAYLFNPSGEMLIDRTLGLTELIRKSKKTETIQRGARWEEEGAKQKTKKIEYETKQPLKTAKSKEINLLKVYSSELEKIKKGRNDAAKYHNTIFNILKGVLGNRLRNPAKEENIAENTQRIDITFSNRREFGFFQQLDQGYHIVCPNIFFECKNYKEDIENPEFAQIQNRLNKIRGQFGVIVCREIDNIGKVQARQRNLKNDDKFVIVLVDEDIKNLVPFKLEGKEEKIDTFFEDKFNELI